MSQFVVIHLNSNLAPLRRYSFSLCLPERRRLLEFAQINIDAQTRSVRDTQLAISNDQPRSWVIIQTFKFADLGARERIPDRGAKMQLHGLDELTAGVLPTWTPTLAALHTEAMSQDLS